MSDDQLATDEAKTALENSVSWYLADKLTDPATVIATNKYLTTSNLLIYLTRCNVAEPAVPKIKVQVLQRVPGGVHETGYQLYGDHRLEKYQNDMIFGDRAISNTASASQSQPSNEPVSQTELQQVLQLVASLQQARQTL